MKQQILFMNLESRLPKDDQYGDQKPLLMKYFPKYQKSMTFRGQDGPLRHKVKSIKVLRKFYTQIGLEKSKQWRLLLANKMKSVKAIGQTNPKDPNIINKLKLLTGLKSLEILLDHSTYAPKVNPKVEALAMRKIWKRINCLQNLKSLQIIGLPKQHKGFIKDLTSSQRLLKGLRNFELVPDGEGYESAKYLEIISNEKEIIKHVTNLGFGPMFSPLHFQCFQKLADSCPKLSTLGFEFYNRNMTFSLGVPTIAKKTFPVTTNYLSTLKTFNNLKTLWLSITDTLTFIKDIAFPSSIQDLSLHFLEVLTNEVMMRILQAFPDEASRDLAQQNFYNQFQSLHNLKSLRLTFEDNCDQESYKTHIEVYKAILKRIPTLKKLNIDRSSCSVDLNKTNGDQITDFYVPQILESCHHLGDTLESIEIGHDRAIYPQLDLSSSRGKFNKLSKVKITGKLEENSSPTEEDNLHLLGQVAALGDSLTLIRLWTFGENTVEYLLGLLRQVNKIERSSTLNIEIQIRYEDNYNDLGELKGDLEKVASELRMIGRARGVSLKLYTDVGEFAEDFIKIYGEKFDSLEICSKYEDFE